LTSSASFTSSIETRPLTRTAPSASSRCGPPRGRTRRRCRRPAPQQVFHRDQAGDRAARR
jgi:hypothetical protein